MVAARLVSHSALKDQRPVAQPSDLERDLQLLEAELRKLEAEYNMFFRGSSPQAAMGDEGSCRSARRGSTVPISGTQEIVSGSTRCRCGL